MTWSQVADKAAAQAAALDRMGIAQGERVAMVSHNSARLLTAFYGVSGYGRILVPVNFRLVAEEVQYIVEHSGAEMLIVDPELDEAMAPVKAKRKVRHRRRAATRSSTATASSRSRGRPTRTPRPPSTTRAAPPPGRRACS